MLSKYRALQANFDSDILTIIPNECDTLALGRHMKNYGGIPRDLYFVHGERNSLKQRSALVFTVQTENILLSAHPTL